MDPKEKKEVEEKEASVEKGKPKEYKKDYQPRQAQMDQQRRSKRFPRKKVCIFCVEKKDLIDYKDADKLRRFVSERGKILPKRITGTCSYHQRKLTDAIKRARNIALLPFKAD